MLHGRRYEATKTCSNCHGALTEGAASCSLCGAEAPRGFLASLGSLFRRKTAGAAPSEPAPSPAASAGPFAFEVEDIFTITGRGTVATGRITRGSIAKNDEISFRAPSGEVIRRRIIAIETFGKIAERAGEGDTVGLLFAKAVGPGVLVRGTVFERA
jgi:hypothetical protein